MKFSVKVNVPWIPCKDVWKLNGELPQQQRIDNFIRLHAIDDVVYVTNADNLLLHEMHVLTINQNHWSLDYLAKTVADVSKHSKNYLWIAINKFFIYKNYTNDTTFAGPNWDLNLLNFVESQLPDWTIIDKIFREDDRGQLGNFEYPVTALVAKKT